jgi:hypothetical protein
VKMDLGRFGYLECFRIMINALGQDFNLPDDGPVRNARVTFRLVEGGVGRLGSRRAIVQLEGNPVNVPTDEAGVARVNVQGTPQVRNLPRWVPPIALNGPDVLRDLVSAMKLALSPDMALLNAIPEVLTRTQIPLESRRFEVRDWMIPNRLTMESDVTLRGQSANLQSRVIADVPLELLQTQNGYDLLGEGSLDYASFSGQPAECGARPVGAPLGLWLALDDFDEGLTLFVTRGTRGMPPSVPHEILTCPMAPPIPSLSWTSGFNFHHQNEYTNNGNLMIRGWTISGDPPVATRIYGPRSGTQGDATATETTVFTLTFGPVP